MKCERERELHLCLYGFCCKFKSLKFKDKRLSFVNYGVMYLNISLSFYISALFTFIF